MLNHRDIKEDCREKVAFASAYLAEDHGAGEFQE